MWCVLCQVQQMWEINGEGADRFFAECSVMMLKEKIWPQRSIMGSRLHWKNIPSSCCSVKEPSCLVQVKRNREGSEARSLFRVSAWRGSARTLFRVQDRRGQRSTWGVMQEDGVNRSSLIAPGDRSQSRAEGRVAKREVKFMFSSFLRKERQKSERLLLKNRRMNRKGQRREGNKDFLVNWSVASKNKRLKDDASENSGGKFTEQQDKRCNWTELWEWAASMELQVWSASRRGLFKSSRDDSQTL